VRLLAAAVPPTAPARPARRIARLSLVYVKLSTMSCLQALLPALYLAGSKHSAPRRRAKGLLACALQCRFPAICLTQPRNCDATRFPFSEFEFSGRSGSCRCLDSNLRRGPGACHCSPFVRLLSLATSRLRWFMQLYAFACILHCVRRSARVNPSHQGARSGRARARHSTMLVFSFT